MTGYFRLELRNCEERDRGTHTHTCPQAGEGRTAMWRVRERVLMMLVATAVARGSVFGDVFNMLSRTNEPKVVEEPPKLGSALGSVFRVLFNTKEMAAKPESVDITETMKRLTTDQLSLFILLMALVFLLVLNLARLAPKSRQQRRLALFETQEQERIQVKKKVAEAAKRDTSLNPKPIKIDTMAVEKSRRMARGAAVGCANSSNGEAGKSTGSAAAAASVQHFKVFEAMFGSKMLELVRHLTSRHLMVNPCLHPAKAYTTCWEEEWNPFTHSRDLEGERIVQAIAQHLRDAGVKFEDPTFPADATSLFSDPSMAGVNENAKQTFRKDQDVFLAGVKGIEWKRPDEWGYPEQKIVMWSGGVDPDDVSQGRLGNCYYLAAMAACALGEDDILLKDVCIEDHADVGMYGVKYFLNGKWVTVVVDDRVPCIEHFPGYWYPIFASPKEHSGQVVGEKELWPMIFEKAWAKLHLSYEATAGGQTDDAASYLSAGILKSVPLQQGADNGEAWDECSRILSPDDGQTFCFLSCAVRNDEHADPSAVGLITGHAYSILKMQDVNGTKLVQVRNPWGEHEWLGDFSDKSEAWTADLKQAVGYEDEEDGSFFMHWPDFIQYFGCIEICDPTKLSALTLDRMCRITVFGSHWVAGLTAGGEPPSDTFKFNPRARVTVESDGPVNVTLFQPDTRCMHNPRRDAPIENQMVSVFVTDETAWGGLAVAPRKLLQCEPWKRQKSELIELKAGHTYSITAATFAPGMQGAFWIALSGQGVKLEPSPFDMPTSEEARAMKINCDPYGCCSQCHNNLDGPFYQTGLGPQCEGCITGSPPKSIIRSAKDVGGGANCCSQCHDASDGLFYQTCIGPVCASCAKGSPAPTKICVPPRDQLSDDQYGTFEAPSSTNPASPEPHLPAPPTPVSDDMKIDVMSQFSAHIGRLEGAEVMCAILVPCMLCGGLAFPIVHSLLMVFAGIKSFRAIQSIDPEDDKQWLTFWLLFSIFEVLCFVTDFVLWAIPSYNGLKCAVLIFLGVFRGANLVYPLLEPLLLQVDQVVLKYEPLLEEARECIMQQNPTNVVTDSWSQLIRPEKQSDLTNEQIQADKDDALFSARLIEAGARTGAIHVCLMWDNSSLQTNDLDLHVKCSGSSTGDIYAANRTVGNGHLDVARDTSDIDCVENVFWDTPEPGSFKVLVNNHRGPRAHYTAMLHSLHPITVISKRGHILERNFVGKKFFRNDVGNGETHPICTFVVEN